MLHRKITFANDIIADSLQGKGDHQLRYTFESWKEIVLFDIFIDISEYVTIFQFLKNFAILVML